MRILTSWKRSEKSVEVLSCQGTPQMTPVQVDGKEYIVPTQAPVAFVKGGMKTCVFGVTDIGLFSLYYSIAKDGRIYIATSKVEAMRKSRSVAKPCLPSTMYIYDGKAVKEFKLPELPKPSIYKDITIQTAGDMLYTAMLKAAEDMKTYAGNKVALLLSGGTDSTLTLLALKHIGCDVKAFSVGFDEEDFDPHWAKNYAEQLDVPYEFIKINEDDEELQSLLTKAITESELSDYSNVLMSICTTKARDVIQSQGYNFIYHGYLADIQVGNVMQVSAAFNKLHPEGSAGRTDENWRDFRYYRSTKLIPNTVWIDKLSTLNGMGWATLFNHQEVYKVLLSLPEKILPINGDKILYWEVLDRFIDGGAWHKGKKIGFYTGAGIGKVRLRNPILSDENMRSTYNSVFNKK